MRTYPTNSAQAAGRIVAMALLSDGHLSRVELELLDRLDVHGQLGLARTELHAVVHGFCEDLLASATGGWADACRVDHATLYGLLAEIEEPALRLRVLQLCTRVVEADNHLADGESTLLMAAIAHWELTADLLRGPAAHAGQARHA